jgi:arylsulfatase A-like enzyme
LQGSRAGGSTPIVSEIDYRTGQILDAIKDAGVADNTIVIFSSDNATSPLPGATGGSNGPWRGDFFNPPFEGSHRVSAVVRWPGQISAGWQSNEIFSAVDWLPTLAGLVGESKRVPTDRPIDGIDASDYLLGKKETSGRDSILYFGLDGKLMSVKWKNFKVIFPNRQQHQGTHHRRADAYGIRPDRRPRRALQHCGVFHGHGVGIAPGVPADRSVPAERSEVSQHQDRRRLQGIRVSSALKRQ